jgi:nucleoside-diphosphate-sugar epimerase
MTETQASDHATREPAGMPRCVLVTGAGGFVGSRVVELLAARGDTQVIALDVVRTPRGEEVSRLPGVELQVVDLRDVDALEALVSRAQGIIHLAAVRTQASSMRPRDAHDINVGATYDLLTLAAAHGIERFVFGSTNTMYGPYRDPDAAPFSEAQPWVCRGINMYAATKLASEAYLEAFATAGGPDYVALRIGPIYGPRVSPGSNGAMTLDILEALDRGERPVVRWAKDAVHSFVYVDDVAAAAIAALTSAQSCLAVNVVGEPVTTAALCERAVELYGHDPSRIEWREERTRYQRVSQDRMRDVLGFVPQTSTDEGLLALIDWHRGRA